MPGCKLPGLCYNCREPSDKFRCKECVDLLNLKGAKEYQQQYRETNREKLREYHREYMRRRREAAARASA